MFSISLKRLTMKEETQNDVSPFNADHVERLFQTGPSGSSLFKFRASPSSPAISSTTSPAEDIAKSWYPADAIATSQSLNLDLASGLWFNSPFDPRISFDFESPFGETISESDSANSETGLTQALDLEGLLNEPVDLL